MRSLSNVLFSTDSGVEGRLSAVGESQPETPHRQSASQRQGKRTIPSLIADQEISHGRDITWTLRAKAEPQHIREARISTATMVLGRGHAAFGTAQPAPAGLYSLDSRRYAGVEVRHHGSAGDGHAPASRAQPMLKLGISSG